jgi:hypothetical protein
MSSTQCPVIVGTVERMTATQLAEACIVEVNDLRQYTKAKQRIDYAVLLDEKGRIVIDNVPPAGAPIDPQWVSTINRNSCRDDLADMISEEIAARGFGDESAIIIEGARFTKPHEVARAAELRGYVGTRAAINKRLRRGMRTWAELVAPVRNNGKSRAGVTLQ